MSDWQAALTPEEERRLVEIKHIKIELSKEARRIFDRARKRSSRAIGTALA